VSAATPDHSIATVTRADLGELLALVRAYCDFYGTAPGDDALLALSDALLADPDSEGVQLIARDPSRVAVGFATIFWSWDTTEGARIAIMHDLYVAPAARGTGLADALIAACVARARARGAVRLEWQTGAENTRARAVYERVGGAREPWLLYALAVPRA
jgi:GNAT superfamily N-acetyltransferase